jgi:hypothetical protein
MTREKMLERIRYLYNGYTWDGETSVYNPFLTLNFFKKREFGNYWYSTGTPSFLIDIIRRHNKTDVVLQPITIGEDIHEGYDPLEMNDEVPLLFQTGYLTIKHKELIDGFFRYTLDMPNMEVKNAFLKSLLTVYGKYHNLKAVNDLRGTMEQQINNLDEAGLNRSLGIMVATVPYELHRTDEAYYHTMMLLWMRLLGFQIQGEVPNDRGRVDAVWEQSNVTVIAEVKYHAKKRVKTLINEAMKQIHDRQYYNKYQGKIILLGVAFSGKDVGCRIEELQGT